jgi:hypothetical protein
MDGETRNDAVPEGDEELPSPFSFHVLNNKQKVSYKEWSSQWNQEIPFLLSASLND